MNKLLALGIIALLVLPASVFAQEKMTEQEAQEELANVNEQIAEAEDMIAELEASIEVIQLDVASLEAQRDELQTQLADLTEEWQMCQYGRYTVIEGDWLTTISAKREVYNNAAKWPMIYESNKDKIKNPNLIYPGWVLLIPYLDRYTVASGDYLSLIASYLSIYHDSKRWPDIYEANKDKIKDPDWIYPKQELIIPHD